MELRYLGFDQKENSRVYRFDVQTDGQPMKEVSVTADLVVFRDHRVGIQEGPFLSGNKLTTDLGRGWVGDHKLTAADVRPRRCQSASRRRTRQRTQGAAPAARSTAGLNTTKVTLAQLWILKEAYAICKSWWLFLHGVLDKNKCPGVRRHLWAVHRSGLDLHPCGRRYSRRFARSPE